jgi:hypothetical protein
MARLGSLKFSLGRRELGGLTIRPGLMDGSLLPELLCQVVQPLQPPDLIQQPFLIALLRLFQAAPGIVDVLWGWQAKGRGSA